MKAAKKIQLIVWRLIFSYLIIERIVNQYWGNMKEHNLPLPDLFVSYYWMSDMCSSFFAIIFSIIYSIVVYSFLIALTFKFIIADLPTINVKLYRTLLTVFMAVCLVDAIGSFLIVPGYSHSLFSGVMDSIMIGLSVWMLLEQSD